MTGPKAGRGKERRGGDREGAERLAELLAVAYQELELADVLRMARRAGIRSGSGEALGAGWVEGALGHLEKRGLVERLGERWRAPRDRAEILTRRALAEGRFALAATVVRGLMPVDRHFASRRYEDWDQFMRELRIGIYSGSGDFTRQVLAEGGRQFPVRIVEEHPLARICNVPFDEEWFSTLPDELFEMSMAEILRDGRDGLRDVRGAVACLRASVDRGEERSRSLRGELALEEMLRGRFGEAERLVAKLETVEGELLRGAVDLVMGRVEGAAARMDRAAEALGGDGRGRKNFFEGVLAVLAILAWTGARRAGDLDRALEGARRMARGRDLVAREASAELRNLVAGLKGLGEEEGLGLETLGTPGSLALPFRLLCRVWMRPEETPCEGAEAEELWSRLVGLGLRWPAAELARAMARNEDEGTWGARVAEAVEVLDGPGIGELLRARPAWERGLEALHHLAAPAGRNAAGAGGLRIAWSLDFAGERIAVAPVLQKATKAGGWTRGRKLAFSRLAEDPELREILTEQDRAVMGHARPVEGIGPRRTGDGWIVDHEAAVAELVGHPACFRADAAGERLELVEGRPELHLRREDAGARLVVHPVMGSRRVVFIREGLRRIRVIPFAPRHRRVAEIVGEGLALPPEGLERAREVTEALVSFMPVLSDFDGAETARVQERSASTRIRLNLLPCGKGLKVELLVRPLGKAGPFLRPGEGGESLMAEVEGRRLRCRRNLEGEREALAELLAACPHLAAAEEEHGLRVLDRVEDALEVLVEIGAVRDMVDVAWPEGERFRVLGRRATGTAALHVAAAGADWFQVEGEIALDEGEVMSLAELVARLDGAEGRFVPLGDGRFLALTESFRRRVEELASLDQGGGKGIKVHALAAGALEETLADMGRLEHDGAWQGHLERMRAAFAEEPEFPSTLRAELRPYQEDGVRWLLRRAAWGAGACLADDMGLGKTVQALACMLARASQGPQLVVAPTSVVGNWEAEMRRFAPTLRPVGFAEKGRAETVAEAGPFDVLVLSYGLLQREAEIVASRDWTTVVLDEAQAIKNAATLRSKAAMKVGAGFRLATTGTPVENRLEELWTLQRFLNPGLLGSRRRFRERFVLPIEGEDDDRLRRRLSRLVSPFVLRRLKEDVLDDLPPKTEITRHVEAEGRERAFYEALRRRAVETVAAEHGEEKARMSVLAQIMRLRRACCHPRLVEADAEVGQAKLDAFLDILDELRANRHKALVFSQFTGYLALVRAALDERGVSYQYLDGSTPRPRREEAVRAFQQGEGDCFLISLRAGGQGLNLTAADYVVHLDPWWNPAVEDQASDRAHRIGQERPVTVYRLVMAGTIEEKIMALHGKKRRLADDLLEGARGAAGLTLSELVALLREGDDVLPL